MTGGTVSFTVQPQTAQTAASAANAANQKEFSGKTFQDALKNQTKKESAKLDADQDNLDAALEEGAESLVSAAAQLPQQTNEFLALAQNQMVFCDFLMGGDSAALATEVLPVVSDALLPVSKGNGAAAQTAVTTETNAFATDVFQTTGTMAQTQSVALAGEKLSQAPSMQEGKTDVAFSQQMNQAAESTTQQTTLQQTAVNQDTLQKTTIQTENPVVLEQDTKENGLQKQEDLLPNVGVGIQTVQQSAQDDVVFVKVSDASLVQREDTVNQLADKIIMRNSNEFDLQLEPEELGKIHIKLLFENGETKVSIFCATQQAMDALANNADKLAAVLENRTGNTTFVQVENQENQFYDHNNPQENANQQERNAEEQRRNQRSKTEDTTNFLDQLRLGLV